MVDAPDRDARLRGARVMHLAISIGLALAGGMFLLARRLTDPAPLGGARRLASMAALALLGALLVVMTVVPRLREARRGGDAGTTPDQRWARWLGDRIVEWAVIEFFGLAGVIGYWLTGAPAMLGLTAVALVVLLARSPDRQSPPS